MIVFRSILLRIFHTKVVKKVKTHILRSITFSKDRAVYERMWKNMVQLDRPQKQYNRADAFALEHVMLLAFPQQDC